MDLFHILYTQPLHIAALEMAALYAVWVGAMLFIGKGAGQKIISAALCAFSLFLIVLFTLVRQGEVGELVVTPFNSLIIAQRDPEFYRTLLMNIFLFVPFGMSVVFILPEKLRHRVVVTVVIGLLLCIAVELSQYIFELGRCETDDVLTNTLGTFIGASTLFVYNAFNRLIAKKKDKRK